MSAEMSTAMGAGAAGAPGEDGIDYTHREHDVLPLRVYYGVFAALIFFTVLTVAVSYMDLGPASLLAAMTVAVIKAGLVAGYFMHLKFDERFNSLVFFSSIVFLAIMFGLTLGDLGSRGMVIADQDNFVLQKDRAATEAAPKAEAPPPAPGAPAPTPPAEKAGSSSGSAAPSSNAATPPPIAAPPAPPSSPPAVSPVPVPHAQ